MARPVIAFLTDFGTKDHYAGTVTGVVLGICPEAACVDITHEIPPHDVMAGALELAAAYKYFPSGTVFVVVVDPGVGSARRPIGAEAGDYRFVAPDNGILTLVFKEMPPRRVVELTEPQYSRPTVSKTFEARDRFGPAAAWLARGIELCAFGRTLNDWQTLDVPEPIITDGQMVAEVVRVDRFGNLVTNVDRRTFDRFVNAERIEIVAGAATVGQVVTTYADADPGASCALFGSSENLEIAVNGGSAAERLALGRGATITISKLHRGA
jgi:S-adenosylmethionine hydrolase